jgi:Transglycosylase SLT domain
MLSHRLCMKMTNDILADLDEQLLTPPAAAVEIPELRDIMDAGHGMTPSSGRGIRRFMLAGLLLTAFGLGWFGGGSIIRYFDKRDELAASAAVNAVVEKIIAVESNGDPNAKSSRSSALGLGQFLDETWLDLIRTYRPDLISGRSETETLELRREAKLAREMTTRLVERNVAMLRQRGLPVTFGTVYLAHFAGGAGAIAILSAPESADAALVMATSDATGRTKREQLVKANPFLEHFTVADLKAWADRKMRSPSL